MEERQELVLEETVSKKVSPRKRERNKKGKKRNEEKEEHEFRMRVMGWKKKGRNERKKLEGKG